MQQRQMGLGIGDALEWRPMTPWEGPPLPFKFKLYWPWVSFKCPVCHERVYDGDASRHLWGHVLDGDITQAEYESYMAQYAPSWAT